MASTVMACLPQLFLLAILLPSAFCIKPVHQYCGLSLVGDLTHQRTSISNVLFNLLGKSVKATFGVSSFPGARNSTTTRGLFQCRTGITNRTCLMCALYATNYLRKTCSDKAEGHVWYDDCFLRYSVDDHFFGRADIEHGDVTYNSHTFGGNATDFNYAVGKVLADVCESAATNSDRFEKDQMVFDGNMTIYGMAQCTQDLSLPTCGSCLESAMVAMSENCSDHIGCRALFSGCDLRYEMFNFLDADDGSQ